VRYIIFASLIIFSCKNSVDKNILASAFDKNLYYDDVVLELPSNIIDTSLFIEKYIEEWVSDQVMLKQALINIDEDDYIDASVEKFKNSLLIFEYQKELINKNFDTTISYVEILDYYNNNIDKFKLDQDIFKGRLVIIDKNAPNLKSLYNNFKSNDDDEIDDLISYCMLYALEYYVNDSSWNYFSPIKRKLPKNISETKIFYSKRKYDIVEDDNFLYLLFIKDFKFKGSISPFSVEKDKIKSLILNENKISYIKMLEKNIVNDAKLSNDIKIY
jgi:hypothetical protein